MCSDQEESIVNPILNWKTTPLREESEGGVCSDQEETYAEEGAGEEDPLPFLSTKFQDQPAIYFQEKLFSALLDKLIGKFMYVYI